MDPRERQPPHVVRQRFGKPNAPAPIIVLVDDKGFAFSCRVDKTGGQAHIGQIALRQIAPPLMGPLAIPDSLLRTPGLGSKLRSSCGLKSYLWFHWASSRDGSNWRPNSTKTSLKDSLRRRAAPCASNCSNRPSASCALDSETVKGSTVSRSSVPNSSTHSSTVRRSRR